MASVSSYSTSSGKRYRVRYRLPDHRQTDRRGFRTKREAELFASSIEISMARGEFVEASAGRAHIMELGTEWLRAQTHLKPSSLRPVEIAWRLHVAPTWASVAVADVRFSDVQAWVSQLGEKLGATSVQRAFGVLCGILDVAVRDRRILMNPARGVKLPRKTPKARVYLSHEQVELLSYNAGEHSTLVQLLAYTGLRWGEATGLRLASLDIPRRRLTVQENAVTVGGRIVVGTPKSHETRSVPFPKFLSEPLQRASEGKSRDSLVFGNGATHLPHPDSRRGWYVSAVRKSQTHDESFPRVTIHDLRHTAASLAISAGANVKVVQRMLGHASAAMTLDTYADLFENDLDAVSDALDNARNQSSVGKLWAHGASTNAEPPEFRGI